MKAQKITSSEINLYNESVKHHISRTNLFKMISSLRNQSFYLNHDIKAKHTTIMSLIIYHGLYLQISYTSTIQSVEREFNSMTRKLLHGPGRERVLIYIMSCNSFNLQSTNRIPGKDPPVEAPACVGFAKLYIYCRGIHICTHGPHSGIFHEMKSKGYSILFVFSFFSYNHLSSARLCWPLLL